MRSLLYYQGTNAKESKYNISRVVYSAQWLNKSPLLRESPKRRRRPRKESSSSLTTPRRTTRLWYSKRRERRPQSSRKSKKRLSNKQWRQLRTHQLPGWYLLLMVLQMELTFRISRLVSKQICKLRLTVVPLRLSFLLKQDPMRSLLHLLPPLLKVWLPASLPNITSNPKQQLL